jgi:hypothetical protein
MILNSNISFRYCVVNRSPFKFLNWLNVATNILKTIDNDCLHFLRTFYITVHYQY